MEQEQYGSGIQVVAPSAVLRAKFKIDRVAVLMDCNGQQSAEELKLSPVYGNSEENKNWSKWTPSGTLELYITNPSAFGKVRAGQEYYVDLTPAPVPEVVNL